MLFKPDIDELYVSSKSTSNHQIVIAWQEARCRQSSLGWRSDLSISAVEQIFSASYFPT